MITYAIARIPVEEVIDQLLASNDIGTLLSFVMEGYQRRNKFDSSPVHSQVMGSMQHARDCIQGTLLREAARFLVPRVKEGA